MYIFFEQEKTLSSPLAWFIAEGRSIFEVLTMINLGYLNKMYYKTIGASLCVGFYNTYEISFKEGTKYWLALERGDNSLNSNYYRLTNKFNEDEWFPYSYRFPILDIDAITMKKVYDVKCKIPECPTDDEEFIDDYFEELYDDMFTHDDIPIFNDEYDDDDRDYGYNEYYSIYTNDTEPDEDEYYDEYYDSCTTDEE